MFPSRLLASCRHLRVAVQCRPVATLCSNLELRPSAFPSNDRVTTPPLGVSPMDQQVRFKPKYKKVSKKKQMQHERRAEKHKVKLAKQARKEHKEEMDAYYKEKLRGLLQERHDITFKSLDRDSTLMREKYAKKGWKLALVLHWKEFNQDERVPLIIEPESAGSIANRWADEQEGFVSKNEKTAYRARVEKQQLAERMKWVKDALKERDESAEINDVSEDVEKIGSNVHSNMDGTVVLHLNQKEAILMYRLQDSILKGAGIELPPRQFHLGVQGDKRGEPGGEEGEDDDEESDDEEEEKGPNAW